MLFNSFEFIFLFLPIALFVAKTLRGAALLRWISLVSVIFYSLAGQVWFIFPMLITTVVDFFVAQKLESLTPSRNKRLWFIFSLAGNLGLLAYFKYAGLMARTIEVFYQNAILSSHFFQVALPAGISFYTFQSLAYIIDVYRGDCHAEKNFYKFLGFISFFPHLVAGPLTRHNQLLPGLTKIAQDGIKSNWSGGLCIFAVGLCKKVILGDSIGALVDSEYLNLRDQGFVGSWIVLIGYALQIYFDFSGYSDMAIGLGRLFGIELPLNFNEPYRALSPSDFWNRWHITLSSWLRDYLYISLGGNRRGQYRRYFNLMVTMVIGGLWHGANWTFAAWGLFHGLILVFYQLSKPAWDSSPIFFQRLLTFILVCLGWIFFRADKFSVALEWVQRVFGFQGLGSWSDVNIRLILWCFVGLFSIHFLRKLRDPSGNYGFYTQIGLGLITAMAFLLLNNSSRFLYFQF